MRAGRVAHSHLAQRAPAERLVEVVRDICGIHAQVMGSADLLQMQQTVDAVYVDPALMDYAVRVVSATRQPAAVGLRDLALFYLGSQRHQ